MQHRKATVPQSPPQINISRQLREDSAAIFITKVRSSPNDTLQAVMQGIEALTAGEIRVGFFLPPHTGCRQCGDRAPSARPARWHDSHVSEASSPVPALGGRRLHRDTFAGAEF
jgi:hypothetical protein